MMVDPSTLDQRTKEVGEMLRNARLAADRPAEECAQVIGVEPSVYVLYEQGERSISLPELESIAYFLDVPLEHFWEPDAPLQREGGKRQTEMQRLLMIRHRMIGALLRQARLEAKVTLEKLAQYMQVDIEQIEAYELGLEPVPLAQLEVLSGVLNRSIREFHDKHGPVGVWNAQQRAIRDFLALPVELQLFVSKPVNRPYLDLAVRLSEMSVERLRAVAEGLLEITY